MNTTHYTGPHAACQAFFRLVFVFPDAVSASLVSSFPDLSARPRAGRAGVPVSRRSFERSPRPAPPHALACRCRYYATNGSTPSLFPRIDGESSGQPVVQMEARNVLVMGGVMGYESGLVRDGSCRNEGI